LINDPCLPPSIYQESVLALDLTSGLVNWVRQLTPLDVWTVACGVFGFYAHDPILCPGDFGPDADFGMAPTFVTGGSGSSTPNQKDTVVVGQKNGRLYALSAQAGQVMWDLQTSPGGVEGGLIWGIAVDDERIYFTAVNSDQVDFTLPSSGGAITYSAFGSASLLNGSLLWEVPTPFSSVSYAMPTVVGDLVLVATTMPLNATSAAASHGEFLALDKRTGRIVLDLAMDNVVHGGIAVQDEYVLFGTGYSSNVAPASFHVLKV
jgi:outer membrane protein assembly factor BamB